jgi:DNA-binding IclR family transcriptional regulator
MASRKQKPRQGIQSVEVGMSLLRVLSRAAGPQMLKDLAAAAHMPAAKAHRYLVSLTRMGLVEQQAESGLYDLGPFALDLGLSALARLEPVTVAAAWLPALRAETGQTVALAVWANQGPTIVRWLGADTPVSASLRVGSVMPLTRSATGQAFLAFLPRPMTERWLKAELADNARNGIAPSTPQQLEQLVATARRQGFARTSDFIPGIAGIAAPVRDHAGEMALALVALGYSKPFEGAAERITAAVLRNAQALSGRLGWAGAPV